MTIRMFKHWSASPAVPDQTKSDHLLELQKEIKEEEEEIFADINSLINGRSNLYSTLGIDDEVLEDSEQDDGIILEHDDEPLSTSLSQIQHTLNNHSLQQLGDFQNHTVTTTASTEEHLFTNDSDDYNSHSADDATNNDYNNESADGTNSDQDLQDLHHKHHFRHHSHNKVAQCNHYDEDDDHTFKADFTRQYNENVNSQYLNHSHDQPSEHLDEDSNEHQANHENNPDYIDESNTFAQCNQADQPDYQALQAVIQQVTSNLPKPCVFFLEGNCRRSDCKYSHDLSNITCKYWIEGFCFKGEMCPFLHSYAPPGDLQDLSLLDDDEIQKLSKKELNPTFVIESEADFPSLPLDAPVGALSDTTKSCNNTDAIATSIKNQILSSNTAVVFKTVKKKRKRG